MGHGQRGMRTSTSEAPWPSRGDPKTHTLFPTRTPAQVRENLIEDRNKARDAWIQTLRKFEEFSNTNRGSLESFKEILQKFNDYKTNNDWTQSTEFLNESAPCQVFPEEVSLLKKMTQVEQGPSKQGKSRFECKSEITFLQAYHFFFSRSDAQKKLEQEIELISQDVSEPSGSNFKTSNNNNSELSTSLLEFRKSLCWLRREPKDLPMRHWTTSIPDLILQGLSECFGSDWGAGKSSKARALKWLVYLDICLVCCWKPTERKSVLKRKMKACPRKVLPLRTTSSTC